MNTTAVELTLQFLQNLDYLHLVTGTSRLLCDTIKGKNLPKRFADEVELAVSEACTNAIRHAADADAAAMVVVKFRVTETELVIEVSDPGAGFNFADVPEPEFDRHPESGYGLYIIRKMMDEVQYARGDKMNTLTLKKYLNIEGDLPL